MFNLIYESTTNNEGYDLVKPNRYINCMASVKELFAILDEKELNDPNISWECVQVTCYALVDEWYTRVYENCHSNVVSNNSLGFTKFKYIVFDCENDTYQKIINDIGNGKTSIVLSEYGVNSARVKYSGMNH